LFDAQNKVGLLVHIYISAFGRIVCLISPAQPAMISRVGGFSKQIINKKVG
jgi:hypothetical protein